MTQSASGSVELVQRMLTGRMSALPRIGFSIVDVRDVVDLHLLAPRAPAARGERFIAAGDFPWMSDIARLLREELGARAARVPRRPLPDVVLRVAALFQNDARTIAPLIGQRSEFDVSKSAPAGLASEAVKADGDGVRPESYRQRAGMRTPR